MQLMKLFIYQTQQIREMEALAQERFGLSETVMMQRAGHAALDFLLRRWPHAQKIAVFCGGGSNGGDGYVLAQYANERHIRVTIYQVGTQDHLPTVAKEAMRACQKMNIPMHDLAETTSLENADVIVDAICGIGAEIPMRENVVAAIEKMHHARLPILALDIPTGIHADTGEILGSAIHAAATITFIGLKLGLLTGSGTAHTGELAVNELQFPAELFSYIEPVAEKIQLTAFANYLKPRPRDWHKGLSGRVLVIGGEVGFSGAPRMAAEAALRIGAGLVSVATHPENAIAMNANCPEIMCHGIKDANELVALMTKADVLVIGPGLGKSAWANALWEAVKQTDLPVVVDADALNILAEKPCTKDQWILTPHPGEAGRMLQMTAQQIQADRLTAVKEINRQYGGVSVLKGAGTLIVSPNSLPALCDKGNPGMATAGMGDVLSGVIGGLIAQGLPLGDAAKLGVLVHAMAGDLAAKDGERGMIATDLMQYLRRLANYAGQ